MRRPLEPEMEDVVVVESLKQDLGASDRFDSS